MFSYSAYPVNNIDHTLLSSRIVLLRLGPKGVQAIGEMLQHSGCCLSLTHLDLSQNFFADEGANLLALGLKHLSKLRILSLSCNKLGGGGVQVLVQALSDADSLNQIDLAGAHCPSILLLFALIFLRCRRSVALFWFSMN